MSEEREQAIRERAYAIWEQEGCPEDRSLAHWLQAEAEIGAEKIVGITDDAKVASDANPVRRRRR